MNSKKIDLANFDFSQFQKEAIDKLKSGQSLTGKDGILTPLIKEILEAALEGEMDSLFSTTQLGSILIHFYLLREDEKYLSSCLQNTNRFPTAISLLPGK